jgi:hypothetical protein
LGQPDSSLARSGPGRRTYVDTATRNGAEVAARVEARRRRARQVASLRREKRAGRWETTVRLSESALANLSLLEQREYAPTAQQMQQRKNRGQRLREARAQLASTSGRSVAHVSILEAEEFLAELDAAELDAFK